MLPLWPQAFARVAAWQSVCRGCHVHCMCELVAGTVTALVMGPCRHCGGGRSSVEERRNNRLVCGSKFLHAVSCFSARRYISRGLFGLDNLLAGPAAFASVFGRLRLAASLGITRMAVEAVYRS